MKKTILITGSTDGIGKITAIKLANEDHQIILHGRNKSKLDLAQKEIIEETGNPNITVVNADFSDLKDVKACGTELANTIDKLDVLINNAGVYLSQVENNSAGFDMRYAVNYFAPCLLTHLLLPLLKKSEEPRIINLSSAAQEPVSFDVLTGKSKTSAQNAYAQSKLALTMWSFHLGKEISGTSVIPVNPGSLLDTKMVQQAFGRSWSTPDKGANILVKLSTLEDYKNIQGKYFDNDLGNPKGAFGTAHKDAYDEELISELMKITNQIIDPYK